MQQQATQANAGLAKKMPRRLPGHLAYGHLNPAPLITAKARFAPTEEPFIPIEAPATPRAPGLAPPWPYCPAPAADKFLPLCPGAKSD